jgi:hypothetical protein
MRLAIMLYVGVPPPLLAYITKEGGIGSLPAVSSCNLRSTIPPLMGLPDRNPACTE